MTPTTLVSPQTCRPTRLRRRLRPGLRRAPRGFTLVELLVSLLILVAVLLGVLALFDLNAKVARVQMHVADMQQSIRIGQYELVRNIRMAGRGTLPLMQFPNPPYVGRPLPTGVALEVQNNVPANTRLGNPPCPCARVLEGTDIVTIRGVFASPIYQINPAGGAFQLTPPTGLLVLSDTSPTGVPQDLEPMKEAILNAQGGDPEALILLSPLDDALYAVVEINAASTFTPANGQPTSVTLVFDISGGTHTTDYLDLSPGGTYPPGLATVSYAGLLEEYRFYVRDEFSTPGDPTTDPIPRLSRARVYPGTDTAYLANQMNLRADLAENIIDLQVALGVDTDFDELITEDDPPSQNDDWLFNAAADDATDLIKWNNTPADPTRLYYVRINTVGRTQRPDTRFQGQPLTQIEDKDYTVAPFDDYNDPVQLKHRRRVFQTVVDLRNIS